MPNPPTRKMAIDRDMKVHTQSKMAVPHTRNAILL